MKCGIFTTCLVSLLLVGCGGGGSSADGIVFQGTLTERGGTHSEAAKLVLKHSAGETIEEVKICILGECSLTDGQGQWGLNVSGFSGGDFTVSVDGHGINTTVKSNIPEGAKEVVMELDHAGNTVTIGKIVIDGEDHSDHDHVHGKE